MFEGAGPNPGVAVGCWGRAVPVQWAVVVSAGLWAGKAVGMSEKPVDTFELWDRDGDGLVSVRDIVEGIGSLGLEVDTEAVERMVAAADTNGDFLVSRAEFDAALVAGRLDVNDADAAFRVFDANGDGRISVEELENLIRHVGAGLIDTPAADLLAAADHDGDGYLSPSEFRALLDELAR
ncbi:calmodulin [Nocardia puris]|uniref:Calmodulin n=2 Tax=Nocardia puris TaxID=208602 RepID=A0A366E2P2_9NOCA|nr:calmodulin [Nocardia puris]